MLLNIPSDAHFQSAVSFSWLLFKNEVPEDIILQ